jgi:tRNA-intron endonuclease
MELLKIKVEALQDGRLIVWDKKKSNQLYFNGFYGKPLGVSKPKTGFDSPLVLDSIEGIYLLEKHMIEVFSGTKANIISICELKKKARLFFSDFDNKFLAYKDLREGGFVVTPGIKYGCDFAVYEEGPGIDHAPYMIQVKSAKDKITAAQIVESGRLATTVRKTFIIAIVYDEKIKYLEFNWWKA